MAKESSRGHLDVDELKRSVSPSQFYGRFFELSGTGRDENVSLKCPFHDDHRPSFSLNLQSGLWCCFDANCGARGDMLGFWMRHRSVDFQTALVQIADEFGVHPNGSKPSKTSDSDAREKAVQGYVERLWTEALKPRREWLLRRRGWAEETLRRWRFGWDGKRFTFPVRDDAGRIVNIRRYLPNPPEGEAKFLSEKGSKVTLFHPGALAHETVILCEGEPDVITAVQAGFEAALTQTGGAGVWKEEWTPLFAGKRVVVVYDTDDAGREGAKLVARALYSATAEMWDVHLPLSIEAYPHGDFSDWLSEVAGRGGDPKAEWNALVAATEPFHLTPEEQEAERLKNLPVIVLTTRMTPAVDAAESALITAGAEIYQRSGALVRVAAAPEPKEEDAFQRPEGSPVIEVMPTARLRELMDASARWVQVNRDGDEVPKMPPLWAAQTLEARGEWGFRSLWGVLTAPTMRPNGSILSASGYDRATGLLLASSVEMPPIPERPTREDAQKGLSALDEAFCDFPFKSESDFAATLAALLTLVGKAAIGGPMPMFAVSAPVAGSGKSKLVNTISLIATGRNAPRMAPPSDETEMEKRISAVAVAGDTLTLIDNVERPLGSEALCAAVTSREIRTRILGQTRLMTLPMNTTFFSTGNNLRFRGDLARRVVPVVLDPRTESPEERTGFRFEPLESWLIAERGRLLMAALTILRAFHVAGRPRQDAAKRFGSFEEWDFLIRHAVLWLTGHDPLAGREGVKADDPERELLETLLAAWGDAFGLGAKNARTIKEAVQWTGNIGDGEDARGALREALMGVSGGDGGHLDQRRIGTAFRRFRDRVIRIGDEERLALRQGERSTSGARWFVESV